MPPCRLLVSLACLSGAVRLVQNKIGGHTSCADVKNGCPSTTGLCRVQNGCFSMKGSSPCKCKDSGGLVPLCNKGQEVPMPEQCGRKAKKAPTPAPTPRPSPKAKPVGKWTGKGLQPCSTVKPGCGRGTGKCRVLSGCFTLTKCSCSDKEGNAVALCVDGKEVPISKKCKDAGAERRLKKATQAARTAEREENLMWKNKYKWKGGVIGRPIAYFDVPRWGCHYYTPDQDDAWCQQAKTIKKTEYGFFGGDDIKSPCGHCDCCARAVDNNPVRFMNYQQPAKTLNFLIVGDWGGNSDANPVSNSQAACAKGIANVASVMNSEFVVGLGDNFYSHGLHEDNKWRFKTTFDDVYTSSSIQVPWYQVAGNHDWLGGSIKLQIELTTQSPRWVLPAPHYSFVKSLPSGKTIKFVMFDHLQIAWNRMYTPLSHKEKKRSHLSDVDWPEKYQTGAEGWSWLENELKSSKDDYLVLVDHAPVYTICSHGDTPSLRGIPEMMKKYRVTAFMSGHDHCVMTQTREGNTFILSGAASQPWNAANFWAKSEHYGGKIDYGAHVHNKGLIYGSFASAEASDSGLQIRHHDQDGNLVHEMSTPLRPRK